MIEQLAQYLQDILGVTLDTQVWGKSKQLPLFLQDSYSYYFTNLCALDLVLMVDNGQEKHSPAMIRKHLNLVRNKTGVDVIYVYDNISSMDRKRLIEQEVPFIIPKNQLYCPMLAMDLRESFRSPRKSLQKLSPASQVLVLYRFFNRDDKMDKLGTITGMAKVLGYSKMTMSRAFKEISVALNTVTSGTCVEWDRDCWEAIQPFLRSPVKKQRYLFQNDFSNTPFLRAGLTALADYTLLAEPSHKIYAISQNDWQELVLDQKTIHTEKLDEQMVEVEIWSYSPQLFASTGAVDHLSLYLSLQDHQDERVETALQNLLEQVKW